jgi:hypothetical protein
MGCVPFVQNKPVNLKLIHFYTASPTVSPQKQPNTPTSSSLVDDDINSAVSKLQIAASSTSSPSLVDVPPAINNALVTVKVDGNRAFLIALDSGFYICEGQTNVFKIAVSVAGHPEYLLDTEIVRKDNLLTIFVFDVVCSSALVNQHRGEQESQVTLAQQNSFIGIGNYTDYRSDTLLKRLAFLGCLQYENVPFNELGGYLVHISRDKITYSKTSGIAIYAKQYFYGNDNTTLYERVGGAMSHIEAPRNCYIFYANGKKFKYEQDGLIFQNADTGYINSNTFKWKPREKVTIDFLVNRISDLTFTLNILDEKSIVPFGEVPEITFESSSVVLAYGKTINVSELDGKVVEFAFGRNDQPIPYRIREDKAGHPNRKNVALDNYNDVKRPIHIDTLLGKDTVIMRKVHNRVKESELKRNLKGNLADIGSDLKGNLADIGSDLKGNLADIGSGRGADLDKWGRLILAKKLDKVLCIEPDAANRQELLTRGKKIIFDGGKVRTIRDQEVTSRQNNILKHIELFEGGAEETSELGVVFDKLNIKNIASFFSLTFFFEEENKFKRLIDTLTLLPVGGKFFGIVLDGRRVSELLGGNDDFTCDSFKIAQNYTSTSHGSFGLEIITSITDGASMVKDVKEYLVDFDLLVTRLANFGFRLQKTYFLEGEFKTNANKQVVQTDTMFVNIPHNSLVFSSLNRSFCFVRESETEIIAKPLKDLPSKVTYACKNVDVKSTAKELVEKIDNSKKEKEHEEKVQKNNEAIRSGINFIKNKKETAASSSQDTLTSEKPKTGKSRAKPVARTTVVANPDAPKKRVLPTVKKGRVTNRAQNNPGVSDTKFSLPLRKK